MTKNQLLRACAYCALALFAHPSSAQPAGAQREAITPAFAYPIANVPGKTMTALIVTYAPGAKTPAHRHGQAFVVGYVLEGAIRSKLDNGEERVYRVGESGIMAVEGAGGVSPTEVPESFRRDEARYAVGWYQSITADIWG